MKGAREPEREREREYFFLVCVFARQTTNERSARASATKNKKARRERDCERKKLASSTTAFGLWTESDLYSFLFAFACRPSNTCTGEEEVEGAQDFAFQMGDLVERLKRFETLRASSPFLSKSLKKARSLSLQKGEGAYMYCDGKQADSGACHGGALPSRFFLCALPSAVCMAGCKQRSLFL